MLIRRHLLWLALCVTALISAAWGAETPKTATTLSKIDRSIAKQPVYRTKDPRYCLLVFGLQAKYRIWLVLDGDTLYVDRNGDGDLTEAGKSTQAETTESDAISYKPTTIYRPDGKTEEKFSFVLYGWSDFRAGKYSPKVNPAFHVHWKGRIFGCWGDETGSSVWGTSPGNAPVMLIDGPLQMGFEIPADSGFACGNNGVISMSVGVGTKCPGLGSFVHLCYTHNAVPENVHPTADLEFQNKKAGGPPVRVHIVLKERC